MKRVLAFVSSSGYHSYRSVILVTIISAVSEMEVRMNSKVRHVAIASLLAAMLSMAGCATGNEQHSDSNQTPNTDGGIRQSVSEYSWDELSTISGQISSSGSTEAALEIASKYNLMNDQGELDGTQTKAIQLKDGTSATVQIVGFYHDDSSEGGKTGISFMTKNIVARQSIIDDYANPVFWEMSHIRSWLATDMLDRLPSDLSSVIVPVDKITNNSGVRPGNVSGTSDQLWLFSGVELCGKAEWSADKELNDVLNAEGEQYKLFADMVVSKSSSNAILSLSDSWWLRPTTCDMSFVRCVDSHGSVETNNSGSVDRGVVFGFCI